MAGKDRWLALALSLGLFLAGPRAFAQAERTAAITLFDEARALTKAGQHEQACPKYAESARLDPQLGVLLHLAECQEKTGRYASAWGTFRDAADLADRRGDARSAAARDRAAALEAKLSRLTINVSEAVVVPGLEIQRDAVLVGEALWGVALPTDSGKHVVKVTAPGKVPWEMTVTLDGGGSTSVDVPVLVDAAAPAAAVKADEHPAANANADANPGSTQRILGWTGIGVGAAGIVVGIVFHAKRASIVKDRDALCPNDVCGDEDEEQELYDLTDEAKSAAMIGTIGLVAGGVLAVGGLVLVLTAPKAAPSHQTRLLPVFTPHFGGVTLRGSF